jgi:hypothetical protein
MEKRNNKLPKSSVVLVLSSFLRNERIFPFAENIKYNTTVNMKIHVLALLYMRAQAMNKITNTTFVAIDFLLPTIIL